MVVFVAKDKLKKSRALTQTHYTQRSLRKCTHRFLFAQFFSAILKTIKLGQKKSWCQFRLRKKTQGAIRRRIVSEFDTGFGSRPENVHVFLFLLYCEQWNEWIYFYLQNVTVKKIHHHRYAITFALYQERVGVSGVHCNTTSCV